MNCQSCVKPKDESEEYEMPSDTASAATVEDPNLLRMATAGEHWILAADDPASAPTVLSTLTLQKAPNPALILPVVDPTMFEAIATMRPGVSAAQAAAEGTSRGRFAADTGMTTMAIFGGDGAVEVAATPLADSLTGDVRTPLIVLLSAVGLLLLIAATNVASR